MPSVLLTGRNGFVGAALARELKRTHKLISLVRRRSPVIDYNDETVIEGDLKDLNRKKALTLNPDIIVHAAARLRGRAADILSNNIETTRAMAVLAQATGAKLVFLSSLNALFAPELGSYARSKEIGESILRESGSPLRIIRIPLVMGRDSPSVKTVRDFHRRFGFFPLFGPQEGLIEPVSISALLSVVVEAVETAAEGSVTINLVGENSFSYKEVLRKIIEVDAVPRFVRFPLGAIRPAMRLIEILGLPAPVSTEELRSVNIDKRLRVGSPGETRRVPNEPSRWFEN